MATIDIADLSRFLNGRHDRLQTKRVWFWQARGYTEKGWMVWRGGIRPMLVRNLSRKSLQRARDESMPGLLKIHQGKYPPV